MASLPWGCRFPLTNAHGRARCASYSVCNAVPREAGPAGGACVVRADMEAVSRMRQSLRVAGKRPKDAAEAPLAQSPQPGGPSGARARWSQRVTQDSNALDLEAGLFTWDDPLAIAQSLKTSAELSERRKTTPFQSAMSMLNFYINRAGSQLPAEQRARLEAAKDELRVLFDRPRRGSGAPRRSRR